MIIQVLLLVFSSLLGQEIDSIPTPDHMEQVLDESVIEDRTSTVEQTIEEQEVVSKEISKKNKVKKIKHKKIKNIRTGRKIK